MKYWMKFIDNNNDLILSTSTTSFTGDTLDVATLKRRFNNNFVNDKTVKSVEITFLGKGVNKTFICDIKGDSTIIIDTTNSKEYTTKEFRDELNIIESFMNGKQPAIA